MNIALLQMANTEDRKDYRSLRFAKSYKVWEEHPGKNRIRPELKRMINPENYQLFSKILTKLDSKFVFLYADPTLQYHTLDGVRLETSFAEANYLFYLDQFKRVQEMAQAGNIQAEIVDLANPEQLTNLLSPFKTQN